MADAPDTILEARSEILRLRRILSQVDGICLAYPKGERCCLPIGHEGGHRWAGGD